MTSKQQDIEGGFVRTSKKNRPGSKKRAERKNAIFLSSEQGKIFSQNFCEKESSSRAKVLDSEKEEYEKLMTRCISEKRCPWVYHRTRNNIYRCENIRSGKFCLAHENARKNHFAEEKARMKQIRFADPCNWLKNQDFFEDTVLDTLDTIPLLIRHIIVSKRSVFDPDIIDMNFACGYTFFHHEFRTTIHNNKFETCYEGVEGVCNEIFQDRLIVDYAPHCAFCHESFTYCIRKDHVDECRKKAEFASKISSFLIDSGYSPTNRFRKGKKFTSAPHSLQWYCNRQRIVVNIENTAVWKKGIALYGPIA